jgi:hypothetical protein
MRTGRLAWRRHWYSSGARFGVFGYRVGSWQHSLQALRRPLDVDLAPPVVAAFGAVAWFLAWGWMVWAGSSPRRGWWLSGVVVGLGWLATALVTLIRDMRRAGAEPPPTAPGQAGVREPRHPPPTQPAGAIALEPQTEE